MHHIKISLQDQKRLQKERIIQITKIMQNHATPHETMHNHEKPRETTQTMQNHVELRQTIQNLVKPLINYYWDHKETFQTQIILHAKIPNNKRPILHLD